MSPKAVRNFRCPQDVWLPAKQRAKQEKVTITSILIEALRQYGQGK